MPSNERYQKDFVEDLEDILHACLWEQIGPHFWEKGHSRLLVDSLGIFLYRCLDGQWVRTHGVVHNQMTMLKERAIWFVDGLKLDLISGEW